MQVGHAISSSPESKLTLDLKEYASRPISFIRSEITTHGVAMTREFIERARIYPFISDLFGEWLARNDDPTPERVSTVLTTLTREVIGNLTLAQLCEMLEKPFALLADDAGTVDPALAARALRELQLSTLAAKLERRTIAFKTNELEQILSAEEVVPTQADPVTVMSGSSGSGYKDFLSELKEAGVIIPPSAKDRKVKTQPAGEVRSSVREVSNIPAVTPAKTKAAAVSKPSSSKQKIATLPVESILSPEAREKILTKIFRDDQEDFARSMELINKAKDWKQASIYLDALFMRRKVDPYSRTATRLTDAVYVRFNSLR